MDVEAFRVRFRTVPLKYVSLINQANLSEQTAADYEFRYLDISAMSAGEMRIPDQRLQFSAAPSRARRIARPGSTVISTVRTYLRAVGLVPDSDDPLVFSTGFLVSEPDRSMIDNRFLYYACSSEVFISKVVAKSVGVSYPAISPEALGETKIPFPSQGKQRRIADFLDDQVARIAAIVGAHEAQIALIEEEARSRFERELSSLSGSLRSLRSICTYFTDGDWIESPHITNEGIRLIQTGNIGIGIYREQGFRFINDKTFSTLRCKRVLPGDVLISRLGSPVARACIAPFLDHPMICSVDVVIARPHPDVMHTGFLVHFLSSPRHLSDSDELARGATMERLSRTQLGAITIPAPDLRTQKRISDALDEVRNDRLARHATLARAIDLLLELKRSLITAAVTGELDVSTADGSRVSV